MKVLFVSLSLPPFAESQTIRSAYMIEALAQRGVQFDLLTAEVVPSQADETLLELMPKGVRFWRTASPAYDLHFQQIKARGSRLALYLYSNLAYRLYVPDIRRGWDTLAVSLAEQIRNEVKPDLLLSASGSCTAHLACATLKKRWDIPWIADFGDPWSWVDWQHPDTWLKAIANSRLERSTLPLVDHLVVTTESTAEAYRHWFGRSCPPVQVVPFGYRSVDFPNLMVAQAELPITISYVGSASRRARNLIPLIRALAPQSTHPLSYRLQIVGSTSHHFLSEAQCVGLEHLESTGRISYSLSLKYIRSAGILALVGNRSPYQVPGKTFLYLASGRPVLYLAQMPKDQDPTYALLKSFAGVRWVPNEESAISEFLGKLSLEAFREWEHQANLHPESTSLREYEISRLTKPLVEQMSKLGTQSHVVSRG